LERVKTRLRRSSKTRSPSLSSPAIVIGPTLNEGDAGIAARILATPKPALQPPGLRPAEWQATTSTFGRQSGNDDFIVWPEQVEPGC